jgi:hydroxymethylpyrimidine pyrophosphatase-like HAD family hydrolase
MKLIKLSDTHYIICDDSELKEGDWTNKGKLKYFTKDGAVFYNFPWEEYSETYWSLDKVKKVIYSTQPLEFHEYNNCYFYNDIKKISLSEVEELINGYNVEKMGKEILPDDGDWQRRFDVIKGFNAHKELVKDKFFTVDDMKIALSEAFKASQEGYQITSNEIIQSLLPKTEWEVEFDEQGKLKLT